MAKCCATTATGFNLHENKLVSLVQIWSFMPSVLLVPPTLLSKAGPILATYKAWRLSDSILESSELATTASSSRASVTDKSPSTGLPGRIQHVWRSKDYIMEMSVWNTKSFVFINAGVPCLLPYSWTSPIEGPPWLARLSHGFCGSPTENIFIVLNVCTKATESC